MYGHNPNKMDSSMRTNPNNLRTISVMTGGNNFRNFGSGLDDSPTSARKSPLGFTKNDLRTSTMYSKDFDPRKSLRASQDKKKAQSVLRQTNRGFLNRTV